MKDIKLIIDGKEIPLTEAQLAALTSNSIIKNPFRRVAKEQEYYYISYRGNIEDTLDSQKGVDNMAFNNVNYFNDKDFALQVSLRQLLYRKLLKFAWDNDARDIEWNGNNEHYSICYDYYMRCFLVPTAYNVKSTDVFFSSKEGAQRAIKEVIEPFMKEHPEFVW